MSIHRTTYLSEKANREVDVAHAANNHNVIPTTARTSVVIGLASDSNLVLLVISLLTLMALLTLLINIVLR